MPRCIILMSFPLGLPCNGGQARAGSIARALTDAGWKIDTVGIYHADLYPADEWGALDIVLSDPAVSSRALHDPLFSDLHVARRAADDSRVVDQLRMLIERLQPDVIQVEQPWTWFILEKALRERRRPKVVYSCHNIEWKLRLSLLNFGLRRPDSDDSIASTRSLERNLVREADLTMVISDIDGASLTRELGRNVAYVAPVSNVADGDKLPHPALSRDARETRCRYAALIGSDYWPNVEGFFHIFPYGLGFLTQDQQLWVAGSIGKVLCADSRYQDFKSVYDSRLRVLGYIEAAEQASFFGAASCVIVPALGGAGAKQRMADALASNRPVIAMSSAIEGCGPILHAALDRGIYVADTPSDFRDLMRRALRDELTACPAEVQDRVSPARMIQNLTSIYAGMGGLS